MSRQFLLEFGSGSEPFQDPGPKLLRVGTRELMIRFSELPRCTVRGCTNHYLQGEFRVFADPDLFNILVRIRIGVRADSDL